MGSTIARFGEMPEPNGAPSTADSVVPELDNKEINGCKTNSNTVISQKLEENIGE